ncbi:hypothetical protein [Variovorax sp. PBL-H6]|uniref:hypothetical protein n=1 Tax=Variovorax sp. PBL-H6 TaxID=434009 RepID=UPI0013A5AE8D|nr:hypothetical protein [Variovorax sp. PBL-H6]
MENPPIDQRAAYLTLASCFAIMAIYYFIDPPFSRPAGGRWSSFLHGSGTFLEQAEFKVIVGDNFLWLLSWDQKMSYVFL